MKYTIEVDDILTLISRSRDLDLSVNRIPLRPVIEVDREKKELVISYPDAEQSFLIRIDTVEFEK